MTFRSAVVGCFLILSCLEAKLENHFKPFLDVTRNTQVRNIDAICIINLDQRTEKFAYCKQQLEFYGITPSRFSAVNGWELSLETLNDIGVKFEPWMSREKWGTCYLPDGDLNPYHEVVHVPGRNYFCHCMSRGAIGIVLSHLSILQHMYESGMETLWVMEDDIDVIKDPHLLSELIDRLDHLVGKEGWDVLFTDRDTKNNLGQPVPSFGCAWRPNFVPSNPGKFAKRDPISPDFRQIGSRFGAYSMIVRRSGMKKILDFFNQYKIFLPYDIEYVFPEGIKLFTVLDDVVSTRPNSPSDNGAPNYKDKEKTR